MGEATLVEVTDRTWEMVVERSKNPVIVMFYSPACAFCRSMEPYFLQYSEEYKDLVVFARLDITSNMWTAERYGVRGTPTFKFFCLGKPVSEMVGAVYPALLKRMVDEGIKNGEACVMHSTAISYDITGYG
jgi:thioredoxin-like negative regulator of GroEL